MQHMQASTGITVITLLRTLVTRAMRLRLYGQMPITQRIQAVIAELSSMIFVGTWQRRLTQQRISSSLIN